MQHNNKQHFALHHNKNPVQVTFDTMEMHALREPAHQESLSKSRHKLPQNGPTCHISKEKGKQRNKENCHNDIIQKG